jgi:hypothetical protein
MSKSEEGAKPMNAIQFIKEQGVEKAREVVEGAPELAEYYSTIDGEYYRIEINAVNLKQLKRLVESMGIVERFGGIELSKEWISEYSSFPYRADLEQAIADYESIYSVADQ